MASDTAYSPKMGKLDLKAEQEKTLAAPRHKYSLLAWFLFLFIDLFYGRRRTFSKFKVLEVIARVPYQAWEHVAYIAMTHTYAMPGFPKTSLESVERRA